MEKYVFIYRAPASAGDEPAPSPEEIQAIMGQWNDWATRVGQGMVDFGYPLDHGVRVAADGSTSPLEREVRGYSIIEAADQNAAVDLAKGHPHLSMSGGCEIEVHEALPIPGM